jgi:hypothetical protein
LQWRNWRYSFRSWLSNHYNKIWKYLCD